MDDAVWVRRSEVMGAALVAVIVLFLLLLMMSLSTDGSARRNLGVASADTSGLTYLRVHSLPEGHSFALETARSPGATHVMARTGTALRSVTARESGGRWLTLAVLLVAASSAVLVAVIQGTSTSKGEAATSSLGVSTQGTAPRLR